MITTTLPVEVKDWVSNIGNSTPSEMSNRYCKDAVLLATYENLLVGRKNIMGYFVSFLNKDNLRCTIAQNITQLIGYEQIASGIYLFSFSDNGKNKVVEARYSFVVKDGLIINHHSSETPE